MVASVWVHQRVQVARHLVGLHDWKVAETGLLARWHCEWCGGDTHQSPLNWSERLLFAMPFAIPIGGLAIWLIDTLV